MASFVNAADAVAAAVEIEKRGHEFYVSVKEKATNKEDQDFFAFMAEEENKHKAIFSSMLERLGGVAIPAGATDDEYLLYVEDLLNSHSLFLPDQKSFALLDPYHQAMQFEKDTLLFFTAIEKMVPDSEKKFIVECADEERKHLRMLSKRMTERR